MELIIMYEDHYRQDLKAKMYPTGRVYCLNTHSISGIEYGNYVHINLYSHAQLIIKC
jgi:hypothetical protein